MNIKFFQLSIGGVLLRFYLMMAIVILAGFTGYWLLGILALPVFLSTMIGVEFTRKENKKRTLNKTVRAELKQAA